MVVGNLDALINVHGDNQQVIRIVFRSGKEHKDFIKKYNGAVKAKIGGKDVNVVFTDRSLNWRFVRLANLPPRTDLREVGTRLQDFGKVKEVSWEFYQDKSIPDLNGVKTG